MTEAKIVGGSEADRRKLLELHEEYLVANGKFDMAMGGMAMDASLKVPSTKARHAKTEYGANTDMRVDMARTNLDDPGIGLRNNGRRVLTLRSWPG